MTIMWNANTFIVKFFALAPVFVTSEFKRVMLHDNSLKGDNYYTWYSIKA